MKLDTIKKCVISIILGSAIIMWGFRFAVSNNVFHIPIVLDYFNSAEGPHDPYTQSLKNFVSYFWIIVKSFANENNIRLLFLEFFSLTIILLSFIYIFLVSDSFWKNKPNLVGVLASGAIITSPFMLGASVLGNNEIIVNYLTHSQVVVPFFLLVIWLLFRRSYITSATALGAAFNINAFIAIWGYLIFCLTLLFSETAQNKVWRLKTLGFASVFFVIAALPTIIWIFQTQLSSPKFEPFDYISFLREYYPYHNLLDIQLKNFLSLMLFICFMWSILLVISNTLPANVSRRLKLITIGLTGILTIGIILPYLTSSRLLNNLYPLRMDSMVYWLIAICVGVWISDIRLNNTENSSTVKIGVWSAIFNGNTILALAYILNEYGPVGVIKKALIFSVSVAVALALFYGQPWVPKSPLVTSDIWVFIPLLQCLILGISASISNDNRYFFTMTPFAFLVYLPLLNNSIFNIWITLLILIISTFSILYPRNKKQQTITSIFIIVAAILAALIQPDTKRQWLPLLGLLCYGTGSIGYTLLQRVVEKYFSYYSKISIITLIPVITFFSLTIIAGVQTVQRGGLLVRSPEEDAFIEAQKWARANTPIDTLFLPINADNFSIFSRRPIWVDWKQGAVAMWSPHLYRMWSERHNALKNLNSMADAIDLAQRESIKFIVINKNKTSEENKSVQETKEKIFNDVSGFREKIVFENNFYQIFRVQ